MATIQESFHCGKLPRGSEQFILVLCQFFLHCSHFFLEMRRQIPSTRSLLAFDAVARHQSVSKAAEELNLTHSAVSQQLRLLEEQLGVRLMQRGARGMVLTEAGRQYREQTADDLQRLESHTLALMARREGDSGLLVGAVPVFAERWLAPRLADFAAREPQISLQLHIYPTAYVEEPRYDLAIQYQSAVWPGAHSQPLLDEACVAVAAPQAPWRRQAARGDFRRVPLLHLNSRPGAWRDWLDHAGVQARPDNPLTGHRFHLFSMLVEAVRGGLGAALVPRYAVERELRLGELVLAHRHLAQASQAYSLFVPEFKAAIPAVRAFCDWLREQARAG
uniref:LysR substrate-binding domain-containing protein n=1 Tax=Cupriavidus yeoncheonensis TaxID=1462994 RepID=UPI003F491930